VDQREKQNRCILFCHFAGFRFSCLLERVRIETGMQRLEEMWETFALSLLPPLFVFGYIPQLYVM
jgi:hypothetical protein